MLGAAHGAKLLLFLIKSKLQIILIFAVVLVTRTVHTVVWVLHTGCFSVHVALVRSACPSKLPKAVLEREVCDLSSLIRIKSLT